MMTHFDVFVIGSGIAGQTAAKICAKNKLSVAIADHREYGGTCANRGCDPKKVLLYFADLVHRCRNLKNHGIIQEPKLSWETVQNFKKSFTSEVPQATEKELKKMGVTLYHRSPYFINENEIMVEGKKVSADHFVIATGYKPRPLKFEGHDHLKISDDILNLKNIPKTATFIGSGYVGMEFAYLLGTLGCQVTILEQDSRALSPFEGFLVEKLVKKMASQGVTFVFGAEVEKVEKLTKNYRISYAVKGEKTTHKSRMVFNTAGRIPSIDELSLDKGLVAYNERGIQVNDYMQSVSNSKVYACGDVSDKSLPLTPLSGLQGYIVGENIVHSNSKKFQNPAVPSTVFTHPKLSSVGLTEEEARSRYKSIKVYSGDASNWFNAKREREDTYAFKIIVNERNGLIVGAHLLSAQANDMINIMTTAIVNKMTTHEFKRMSLTYPSFSNDLKSMMKDPD